MRIRPRQPLPPPPLPERMRVASRALNAIKSTDDYDSIITGGGGGGVTRRHRHRYRRVGHGLGRLILMGGLMGRLHLMGGLMGRLHLMGGLMGDLMGGLMGRPNLKGRLMIGLMGRPNSLFLLSSRLGGMLGGAIGAFVRLKRLCRSVLAASSHRVV
jgi:hypothetical protein